MALLAGLGAFGLYRAMRHVPQSYERAVAATPVEAAQRVSELESRATTLYSDVQQSGSRWSSVFSAEQLNAWLATALEEKYPDLLPANVRQPRVAIAPTGAVLAFRTERGGVDTVISVELDAFLSEPDVVALRIERVKAGALPLPAQPLIDELAKRMRGRGWPVQWIHLDGDPVALVSINDEPSERYISLESLEMGEGTIYLAGKTHEYPKVLSQEQGPAHPGASPTSQEPTAEEPAESQSTRHRAATRSHSFGESLSHTRDQ